MSEPKLSVQHLVGIKELRTEDLRIILDVAKQFKEVLQRPIKKVPSLRDITIANLFFENSTRTRMSFELAEKRLSADVINFSASGSSVSKGETLLDTVQNILAMKVDMVVVRHPKVGAARFLSERVGATVINAGDGTHEHPTQALLDAFSIEETMGRIKGVKVALVGDILHSRVALSNILCLKKMGAHIKVCGPPTIIPKYISSLGVEVEYTLENILKWADVINVLRIQTERMELQYFPSVREYSQFFGINKDKLDRNGRNLIIMHPGPINRGVELNSDAADSKYSIILDQVENGVAVRMAVLYLLANSKNKSDA
ncbi:MAG: aspartate carbamoyltransferase catalytic subunit [Saprospiraceae bacterium]|nr:aspartate carbamoyltransferase catalytic subunit [Saprospiraceae bacterium]